jgi:hypothetical protein
MNEVQIREQAARARREFIRWVLLMAAEINSPTHSTLRMLLGVVQGAYRDATELEVRRELDYLESRMLVKVHVDPLNQVSCELTRYGFDIAQYTVAVEPGIARPPKA